MNNDQNSTSILILNLIADATKIDIPTEWQEFIGLYSEKVDSIINNKYYKDTSFLRLNTKYRPMLKKLSRLAKSFLNDAVDYMSDDNLLSISYNDMEKLLNISRPSIYPCIAELANAGIIIYTPGTSTKNPSSIYINPKFFSKVKLSHQKQQEVIFDKVLLEQPKHTFANGKVSIDDGKTIMEEFKKRCLDLKINNLNESQDFSIIQTYNADAKCRVNDIRPKTETAPNPISTYKKTLSKKGTSVPSTDSNDDNED